MGEMAGISPNLKKEKKNQMMIDEISSPIDFCKWEAEETWRQSSLITECWRQSPGVIMEHTISQNAVTSLHEFARAVIQSTPG